MFRQILLAVLLAGTPVAMEVAAQVNIERRRVQKEGAAVELDASVSVRSGNSDLFDVAVGAQFSLLRSANLVLWIARAKYGERDGKTYTGSAFTHLRLTHAFTRVIAGEAFGQLERDQFTLLQLRSLVGSGVRLTIVDAPSAAAHFGSAVMLEFENLDESKVIEHPATSTSVRWSNYASIHWDIGERASVTTTAYVQPQVDDFADIRLLHEAAFDVAITGALSLRVVFRQRIDGRPPDGVEKHDVFLENGVRLRL